MKIVQMVSLVILIVSPWCCAQKQNAMKTQKKIAIVKDGVPMGHIVIAAHPSNAEKFAANQLQEYIYKMSGARLLILSYNNANIKDRIAIVVGRHPAAKPIIAELDRRYPDKYDAIAVVGRGKNLFLVGRHNTGTVWASWDWLESLGVRWLFPGKLGEYVPKVKDIYIPLSSKYDAPRLDYRGPCGGDVLELKDKNASFEKRKTIATNLFLMRMRRNYAFVGLRPGVKYDPRWDWVRKDRPYYIDGGHTYSVFLPASRYYKQHPEWFRMFKGKRQQGLNAQVCYTNEQAAEEFAKNILVRAKFNIEKCGIPASRILLVVSPNDRRPARCECPKCSKLLDKNKSASSQVVFFANRVAKIVKKVYPDVRVAFYAYDDYSFPPEHVKPIKGVCPRVAFWVWDGSFGANHAKPMFSQANHKYRDAFIGWSKMSEYIFSRVYYGHYHWFTPWPKITQMSYDIKTMAKQIPNFKGMWSESYFHWGTQVLNFYVYSKLMWNSNIDVNKVIDDYCQKAFGPAGPAIRKYFGILQKRMDSIDYVCGYTVEISKLLTPTVIKKCDMCIDKAEQYLDKMDDAGMKWRTELVIQAWRASAKFGRAVDLFVNRHPKPSDRQRVVEYCKEVDEFSKTKLGRWAFYRNIARGSIRRIEKPLELDLFALPKGKHKWSDGFHLGGAIKFYASYSGFHCGMWGYTLKSGEKGVMMLPIKAEDGAKITFAKIYWGFDPGDFFKAKLILIDADKHEHIIADNLVAIRKSVVVPKEFLEKNNLRFKLIVENPAKSGGTVYLTNASLEVTVD